MVKNNDVSVYCYGGIVVIGVSLVVLFYGYWIKSSMTGGIAAFDLGMGSWTATLHPEDLSESGFAGLWRIYGIGTMLCIVFTLTPALSHQGRGWLVLSYCQPSPSPLDCGSSPQ